MGKILLWGVYFPVLKIISALFFWVPEVVERRRFEKKNKTEVLCESFKKKGLSADYCFEFSSEGEYQQIASLIEDGIKLGKRFEIVFFSPSVEKAIVNLGARYPEQIRYLRYPLVTFFPGSSFSEWVSAKNLQLVRYDFFPEFLFWAMDPTHSLRLLWVSFKKLRLKGKGPGFYKRLFLKNASAIFYASKEDENQGRALGFAGDFYDFRLEQIRRRILNRKYKFHAQFPNYGELKSIIERYPPEKRLIVGNAWPSDLGVLKEIPEDVFILVVPHKLERDILRAFEDGLSKFRDDVLLTDGSHIEASGTMILNKKGVLCELYADFDHAYVGGGFEGSIHSILEPLVASVPRISCGPAHHRSTEYDLALGLGRVSEVRSAQDFMNWLSAPAPEGSENALDLILGEYDRRKREVFSC